MKSKRDKIFVIVLLVLLICGLCVTLMFCRKNKQTGKEEKDPQETAVQTLKQDVEVSDYEDFDWESNAFETEKEDKKFSQSTSNNDESSSNDTSKTKNDNQLRHDETMNSGIEVEFDSWDSE